MSNTYHESDPDDNIIFVVAIINISFNFILP